MRPRSLYTVIGTGSSGDHDAREIYVRTEMEVEGLGVNGNMMQKDIFIFRGFLFGKRGKLRQER